MLEPGALCPFREPPVVRVERLRPFARSARLHAKPPHAFAAPP
jgi:hypothetical protein